MVRSNRTWRHQHGGYANWRRCTYLCTSPAADPIDRHRRAMVMHSPATNRTRGLRNVCRMCRVGGMRVVAAVHEEPPLPTNMSASCKLSPSSPLAWDIRTDTLRSRRLFVSLRWRLGTRSSGDVGGGESSLMIVAPVRIWKKAPQCRQGRGLQANALVKVPVKAGASLLPSSFQQIVLVAR